MLVKIEYTKYILPLKTQSKQKDLERVWNPITKDPEWAVALQRQKLVEAHHLNSTTLVDTFQYIYL